MARHALALGNWVSATFAICSSAIVLGGATPVSAQAPTTYYGAIAVSPFSSVDPDIRWGAASWLTSQVEADQAALAQCRARGGHACKIENQGMGPHLALWFSATDKVWGVEKGATPVEAMAVAVGECLRKAGDLTKCSMPPDGTSSTEPGRALSIDPKVVGVWEIPVNGGRWFLEVDPRQTYAFHSDANDGAPTTSGSFATSAGYWSLRATTGYTDAGTYTIQPQDTFVATSQRLPGKAYWHHPAGSAPPLDENGQQLYVRLVEQPPDAKLWSLAGTSLVKATGSIAPPVGQAAVTFDLQPLSPGLPTTVMLRIFPTPEAAAAYVDDKQPFANWLTGLPPGVASFGNLNQMEPFERAPSIASTMQRREQRGWLRLAYKEGRVVILVDAAEAKPNVGDNDSISDDLLKKGVRLLQVGTLWLKDKARQ